MVYTLEIFPDNEEVKAYYAKRVNLEGDAGVDLFVPQDTTIICKGGEATLVDLKIKCRMLDPNGKAVSYYLYPRSSIAKTPLVLANSVGIIDSTYRGNIKAAFHCINIKLNYEIMKGTRLVQICAPNLEPVVVKIVDNLDVTTRGEGGFGSTNSTNSTN
jgi:dUTP pyrophosphatase